MDYRESEALRLIYRSGEVETRIQELCQKIQKIVEVGLLTTPEATHIESELRDSAALSEEEFVRHSTEALSPLRRLQQEHPREMEIATRKGFVRESKFLPLNELLSYGRDKDLVHIHLAPARTLSIGELMSGVRDGLRKLAALVRQENGIQRIEATSWIVAAHPKLMERLGFTVTGPISESMQQEHFSTESRPVSNALMSREDFLYKYSPKK